MKKRILIGLLLLSACATVTPENTPISQSTATRITPTVEPVSSPQGATVTPTPFPSPTVTFTPPPPERYFVEEFDTVPSLWSTLYSSGDSERVEILNENSKLTFEIYSPVTWMYVIYGAFEYDGVSIETRVESLGSELNSMGLICNYTEQEGWYEFNISNDASYQVLHGQWLAEGIATYMPILEDTSNRIVTGNSLNEIGLSCYENTIQLYINGKLIRSLNAAHIGLSGGKVGLSLGSFEEVPVILSFDWVKVREP